MKKTTIVLISFLLAIPSFGKAFSLLSSWRQQRYVTSTEDFIARTTGNNFQTPWRIVAVTEKDTDMPVNNLVYALAVPPINTGTSNWTPEFII